MDAGCCAIERFAVEDGENSSLEGFSRSRIVFLSRDLPGRIFRPCQAPPIAVLFPPPRVLYSPRMGGHGRRQPTAHIVAVLDCQSCGAITSTDRLRYGFGRLVCDHCGAENPETQVRHVQAPDIFVSFTAGDLCFAQAMDLDLQHSLGPRVRVSSPETLRRLLGYLGALPEGLNEFDRSVKSQRKGYVRLTLQPGRKNLLRIRE
jgi:hypothetical protein